MRIQIDTTEKTLKLEEKIPLTEFLELLNKIFPNNSWKEYTLETNTIINNWTNPLIVDRWQYPYPWTQPYYVGNTDTALLNSGVYNITI